RSPAADVLRAAAPDHALHLNGGASPQLTPLDLCAKTGGADILVCRTSQADKNVCPTKHGFCRIVIRPRWRSGRRDGPRRASGTARATQAPTAAAVAPGRPGRVSKKIASTDGSGR